MERIETERLVIRDFILEDADDLYAILGDAETMRYCEPPYDFAKTRTFLETFCIGRRGAVAAVDRLTQRVIGYILLNEFGTGVYEMGWIFNRRFWRQGYAFEACGAVIRYAFDVLGAGKVFAESADGVKSVGLMQKLGMAPEGICGGLYVYSLRRTQRQIQ